MKLRVVKVQRVRYASGGDTFGLFPAKSTPPSGAAYCRVSGWWLRGIIAATCYMILVYRILPVYRHVADY